MKTAIDKNESELDKMKREALEWIERHGKTTPPFISVAVNAFPQVSSNTSSFRHAHFEKEAEERKTAEEIFKIVFKGLNGNDGCYHFPQLKQLSILCMEEHTSQFASQSLPNCIHCKNCEEVCERKCNIE